MASVLAEAEHMRYESAFRETASLLRSYWNAAPTLHGQVDGDKNIVKEKKEACFHTSLNFGQAGALATSSSTIGSI